MTEPPPAPARPSRARAAWTFVVNWGLALGGPAAAVYGFWYVETVVIGRTVYFDHWTVWGYDAVLAGTCAGLMAARGVRVRARRVLVVGLSLVGFLLSPFVCEDGVGQVRAWQAFEAPGRFAVLFPAGDPEHTTGRADDRLGKYRWDKWDRPVMSDVIKRQARNFQVAAVELAADPPTAERLQAWFEHDFLGLGGKFRAMRREEMVVNGAPAVSVAYRFSEPGSARGTWHQRLFVVRGRRAYSLLVSGSPGAAWAADRSLAGNVEVERFFQSFQLKD